MKDLCILMEKRSKVLELKTQGRIVSKQDLLLGSTTIANYSTTVAKFMSFCMQTVQGTCITSFRIPTITQVEEERIITFNTLPCPPIQFQSFKKPVMLLLRPPLPLLRDGVRLPRLHPH